MSCRAQCVSDNRAAPKIQFLQHTGTSPLKWDFCEGVTEYFKLFQLSSLHFCELVDFQRYLHITVRSPSVEMILPSCSRLLFMYALGCILSLTNLYTVIVYEIIPPLICFPKHFNQAQTCLCHAVCFHINVMLHLQIWIEIYTAGRCGSFHYFTCTVGV